MCEQRSEHELAGNWLNIAFDNCSVFNFVDLWRYCALHGEYWSLQQGTLQFYLTIILLLMQDELFHVPQAKHYCNGEFDVWDKGITTYPGMYLLSYSVYRIINIFQRVVCSTNFLRVVNLSTSCMLPIILYLCRKQVSFFASCL